jgi:hypothetical protein
VRDRVERAVALADERERARIRGLEPFERGAAIAGDEQRRVAVVDIATAAAEAAAVDLHRRGRDDDITTRGDGERAIVLGGWPRARSQRREKRSEDEFAHGRPPLHPSRHDPLA